MQQITTKKEGIPVGDRGPIARKAPTAIPSGNPKKATFGKAASRTMRGE